MKSITLISGICLGIMGCATTIPHDELEQMDATTITNTIMDHTITQKTDYGRWAEYYSTNFTAVGKAWGDWGEEKGTATIDVSEQGELCLTYNKGKYDWTNPNHEFCSLIYTDDKGNYYSKQTKNTNKTKNIGKLSKIDIKSGDYYELQDE